MKELSLHILDIAENSVNAGASKIEVSVIENIKNDKLSINIKDNGKGMDAETVRKVCDPFTTSRTTRKVGLGIPFLKEAAEACQGSLNIDRMPLGNLKTTFLSLIIGYPKVNWILTYQVDDEKFELDDRPIKNTLAGVPLSEPTVINYLKQIINDGIDEIAPKNI